jgi:thioredoxin reductase
MTQHDERDLRGTRHQTQLESHPGAEAGGQRVAPYDVVVVGGGAAGLSAALVLTRAQRRVAVVDSGQPRNAPAAHMHGFLGSDGLPPRELLAAGRREVLGYGGHLVPGVAARIDLDGPTGGVGPGETGSRGFVVTLEDGRELSARRILVTTGLRDDVPDVPGVLERWGRDLLHCPYCHGHEVRNQPLGVLGGTLESVSHALLVRQWSDDVVHFANGATLTADQRERLRASAVDVLDEPVERLVIEDDRLTGVALESGHVVARAAVFVRPTFVPNDALLTSLGCATDGNGWVTVDATGRTSVSGVWAAGNAVNPRAQVITAAGEGSAAAIAVNNDLVEEDAQIAVAKHRLGLGLPD